MDRKKRDCSTMPSTTTNVDIEGKLVSALNALHKELEVSRQKRGSFADENDSSEEVNRRNKGKGTGED